MRLANFHFFYALLYNVFCVPRHVPYACSNAWMGEKEGKNEGENDDELKEKQFWGLDCMVKFFEFIHREYFSGFVLYMMLI